MRLLALAAPILAASFAVGADSPATGAARPDNSGQQSSAKKIDEVKEDAAVSEFAKALLFDARGNEIRSPESAAFSRFLELPDGKKGDYFDGLTRVVAAQQGYSKLVAAEAIYAILRSDTDSGLYLTKERVARIVKSVGKSERVVGGPVFVAEIDRGGTIALIQPGIEVTVGIRRFTICLGNPGNWTTKDWTASIDGKVVFQSKGAPKDGKQQDCEIQTNAYGKYLECSIDKIIPREKWRGEHKVEVSLTWVAPGGIQVPMRQEAKLVFHDVQDLADYPRKK